MSGVWRNTQWPLGVLALATAAALALAACGGGSDGAPQRSSSTADTATGGSPTRVSERGLYRATIDSMLDPIQINKLHAWTMRLETAEGAPVDGAQIGIDVVWPHTGEPMQTNPSVTAEGKGEYLIEGIKLQMNGMWRVSFDIAAAAGRDTLSYDLGVDAAGAAELLPTNVRQTEQGLFQVIIGPERDPIPVNELHSWSLWVGTPDGEPIEGATITVDGDMPAHGHGLPTKPQVTVVPGGYQIEGMKFQMPGRWELYVTISADGKTDKLTHAFDIE